MASLYERVGEMAFFERLVDGFYRGVESDPLLRPLYPEDLDAARERLASFLAQYFGGPPRYASLRGEPRLRLRHLPFPIDEAKRQAWLSHMSSALQAEELAEEDRKTLFDYFEETSRFLVNRGGLSITS